MDRLTLTLSNSNVIGLPTHQNCVNALPIISQDGGRLGTRHQPIDRIVCARNIVVQAVRDAESNLSHDHVPEPESWQWVRRANVLKLNGERSGASPLKRHVRPAGRISDRKSLPRPPCAIEPKPGHELNEPQA